MKRANNSSRCESATGSSKFVDLLSSVNSLIGSLSDGAEQQPQQPLPASTVGAIDSQLRQLERLFSAAPSAGRRRTAKRLSGGGGGGGGRRRTWCRSKTAAAAAAATADGGCSRSPCSNCNSAAPAGAAGAGAGAELLSVSSETEQLHRQHRHHQLSVKPSRRQPASGSQPQFAAANASNRRRTEQRYVVTRRRATPSSHDGSSSAGPRGGGGGGSGGRTRAAKSARDAGAAAPEPPMNFGYLKKGLADDGRGGGDGGGGAARNERSCADTVVSIERLVQNLQSYVAQLILQCQQHQELQRQRGRQHCGLPERLKSEVRRAQARVAALHKRLRQVASTSSGGGGGCRHVGTASEQARDPLSDLRCKYERSLLYCRFDVNWPFLNIIAPRPPAWGQPPCCDEEYYG